MIFCSSLKMCRSSVPFREQRNYEKVEMKNNNKKTYLPTDVV